MIKTSCYISYSLPLTEGENDVDEQYDNLLSIHSERNESVIKGRIIAGTMRCKTVLEIKRECVS